MPSSPLPASKVIVTVGTGASLSALGSTETRRALIAGRPETLALAAVDAGLAEVDLAASTLETPAFVLSERGAIALGKKPGTRLSASEIEASFGAQLRANMGIRAIDRERLWAHVQSDVGAPLAHDLGRGGLRARAGLGFDAVRGSSLRDMMTLFDDDPRLGPSLQTQLFLYGGLGALACLPRPLSELVPDAYRFRVAAASAFQGLDALAAMREGMQKGAPVEDKVAYRLASSLATHGPAMLNTMLSPSFRLLLVKKDPSRLAQLLRTPGAAMRNVPQAPLVSMAACASAHLSFCDAVPHLLLRDYPGYNPVDLLLWTAADAALEDGGIVLEGFGPNALLTREKLAVLNEGRAPEARRALSDGLAPFDLDACGTVVGDAGSGLVVTTLENAVRLGLDVTSIVVGFGQSGETGGKGHMAGVGFGGENALLAAYHMAKVAHGYGVGDFGHLIAHATGTRTNSVTDLKFVNDARAVAAGENAKLPAMTVSAPKSAGDGHTMGETGLRAVIEAVCYLLGEPVVGVPSLRTIDPNLAEVADAFKLEKGPIRGVSDGGVISTVQGFGGYDGALALRAATPDALRRYAFSDGALLPAYLERWSEVRNERVARETRMRRTKGMALALAELHAYPGLAR